MTGSVYLVAPGLDEAFELPLLHALHPTEEGPPQSLGQGVQDTESG